MNKDKISIYLKTLIPIVLVAGLGSIFVYLGMDWFNSLIKPSQWIPNFVIPIVWSIIYITFSVVLIILQNKTKVDKPTTILLIINGILNVLWCLIFFTFNLTFLGNVAIILNLIAGILLVFNFLKYNSIYFYILLIYPTWLTIATTLNLATWILN